MRRAFIEQLMRCAKGDPDLYLLTGDLGFSVLEPFRDAFPGQYVNCGVAEQNMIGVAAGLALSSKTVFVYSIVPFVTMRCLEQIRNDLCLHQLNVNLVGVGGGFHYGAAGSTHHALTDMSLMRSLPNMTVVSPATLCETAMATLALAGQPGPSYLRLSKCAEGQSAMTGQDFEIGKGRVVMDGTDMTLMTTGEILGLAVEAAGQLSEQGVSVRLIHMPTVKPVDTDLVLKAAEETQKIFTLEEHSVIGGLGAAVSEVFARSGRPQALRTLGLSDAFEKRIGPRDFLREKRGLSVRQIVEVMLNEK